MAIFHGNAIPSAASGYDIDNSCRFNDDDTQYLSKSHSSSGNRRTYTISLWVKRGNLSANTPNHWVWLWHYANSSGTPAAAFGFKNDDRLGFIDLKGVGGYETELLTSRKFRDLAAWYHLMVAVDTTQNTPSDRVKIYVNGVQETAFDTTTYPTQNYQSETAQHTTENLEIARDNYGGGEGYIDGYLAEYHVVDGTALGPDSFGEVDEDYGHWKPIRYTGSHGTNGFHLDFANSGSLGNDAAGSNNFTSNNITASDQMVDTPTNNFCVFNPLDNYWAGNTYAESNLKVTTGLASYARVNGTIGVSSGKWYFEMRQVTKAQYNNDGGNYISVGISEREATAGGADPNQHPGASSDSYGYYSHDGYKMNNHPGGSGRIAYGDTYTEGDIVGVAFDLDNNKIYFSKNGTWQDSGDPTSGATGTGAAFSLGTGRTYRPSFSDISGHATGPAGVCVFNFGQDGTFAGAISAGGNADDEGYGNFKYDVPTGFLALCSKNLSEPAVVPSENFEAVIYTGNNATTQAVTTSFEPDMVWNKIRNVGYHHRIFDRVRGFTNSLYTNGNYAENTYTDYGYITGTSATSVTIGQGTHSDNLINDTGNNGVAWNWKANGASSSNTDGSITSTVSANVDAGFSIVSYTGTGSNSTIGHGLNSTPEVVLIKRRDASANWYWYTTLIDGSYDYYKLDQVDPKADSSITGPGPSVFNVKTSGGQNASGGTYIAYCFHSVEGYSKIGLYKGNGNPDGTFVYTGFRPAYVMMKRSDSASSGHWLVKDSKRDEFNSNTLYHQVNENYVEADNTVEIDYLSNGFKQRSSNNINNANNSSYIYIAFAETPFKHANAR